LSSLADPRLKPVGLRSALVKRKLNSLAEEQVKDTSVYVLGEGRRYPWNVAAHAIMGSRISWLVSKYWML